ncbi:MAG: SMC-Scp complex subunit ScpB [Opitutaceae bacterium]|jgi:segregation and condensation protein B|nr:SMC-Scp complex subunit ScpB [Opitutaceae bacterium]
MAFNLKKVLKALLLSSNQPLSIKDIQGVFTRFHEQQTMPLPGIVTDYAAPVETAGPDEVPVAPEESIEAPVPEDIAAVEEPVEAIIDGSEDVELYQDVPSLITTAQIREAMDVIAAELRAADEGLLLIEGSSGYRLMTQPRFARWLRILRQEPPPVKLSQSALETLAVVSYRQPVTRTEIETIRGVSAEAGVNKLLERDLIYIVGRADLPGRPLQYGTTDRFLEFAGMKSIDELPASDVLSSRQIDEWLKNTTNAPTPTDADMGLPEEQLPLEAVIAAEAEAVAANTKESQVNATVEDAPVITKDETAQPSA